MSETVYTNVILLFKLILEITGVRGIPTEILSQIADIYGTSVDYLIGRTNVKKPYPKK